MASRDELWSRGVLIESRLVHGEAIQHGNVIEARDTRDDALVTTCDALIARLRDEMPREERVRLVARATTDEEPSAAMIVDGLVFLEGAGRRAQGAGARAGARRGADRGVRTPPTAPCALRPAPSKVLLWQNGSAAVLLHEAFGHALEHDAPPVPWPAWLHIDAPLQWRRETFRDVPLLRMQQLVATQHDAPFALPDDYTEVHLVQAGHYDPLDDTVTLQISAASCEPFELKATREQIARSLQGATGEPIRYPGVICSREGQELLVPSSAPVLVTDFAS